MDDTNTASSSANHYGRAALTLAATAAIIYAIKLSAEFLQTFIVAVFIGILLLPLYNWLKGKGLPAWLALITLVLGIVVATSLLVLVFYLSLRNIDTKIPQYQKALEKIYNDSLQLLKDNGLLTSTNGQPGQTGGTGDLASSIDFGALATLSSSVLGALANTLFLILIIIVGVIFTILEAAPFRRKLIKSFGEDSRVMNSVLDYCEDTRKFMYLRTINNLIVAVGTTVMLLLLGVDFAILWGVLIFFLSFIPNVGIVIGCLPAVVLALVEKGIITALLVIVLATAINLIGDNVITPRLMTDSLDLSLFAIFFSVLFWAWVLGGIGALLSVPLTLAVKEIMEYDQSTYWVSKLLGRSGEVKNRQSASKNSENDSNNIPKATAEITAAKAP